jgi:hypothetical protein
MSVPKEIAKEITSIQYFANPPSDNPSKSFQLSATHKTKEKE